jgi:hypothetical protein
MLFRTADFAWSRSGRRNTVFAMGSRFLRERFLAIVSGLLDRQTMMQYARFCPVKPSSGRYSLSTCQGWVDPTRLCATVLALSYEAP